MKFKKNQFEINNVVGYKHVFTGKTVYAIRCNYETIDMLLTKLYNKYNSVKVYEQSSFIPLEKVYFEITCK